MSKGDGQSGDRDDTRPYESSKSEPIRELGPYEIVELLGEGGMGLVYRALDRRLHRWVALKLLRSNGNLPSQRLLEEARSQARVEHENVCKVYEAGTIDGQTYIAMQYIEGVPLDDASEQMTLRQRLEVIKKVAEGIHVAHRQGLIHRDLKPGNIMVERTEDGEWKPYVLDFGLAREQAAPGITTTGEVKGTPQYMAPEQVSGEIRTLDPRADVYSLGATLYECLGGQPVFAGSSGLGVLVKVLNEEPEPLRTVDSSLPIAVETIVMRCLEKSPARRYPSARELAEDIQRFLDGEPIATRRASVIYRLGKRIWRYKVATLTTLLVLTALVAGGLLVLAEWRARQLTALEEQFRGDVRYIEGVIRNAYNAPLHDVTAEKNTVRTRLATLHERIETLGRNARGPGHAALGQGYLALQEYETAREHLEIAWQSGSRDPGVAYAFGRVMGALYQQELLALSRLENPAIRQARREEIEQTFRKPALEYLRQSQGYDVESSELVEALIAFWEGRYDQALNKARSAYQRLPWLYEAMKLEGDVQVAIGNERRRQGDYEAASEAFQLADELYRKAQERGRSDPRVYEGLCELGRSMMEMEIYGAGGELGPHFESGLLGCERAIQVDPERPEAYRLKSAIYWRMGEYQGLRGLDPRPLIEQAVAAAHQAVERRPDDFEALKNIGWANAVLADWHLERGEDPSDSLAQALAAFRRAVAIDANDPPLHNGIGYTLLRRGFYELASGRDPTATLDEALESLRRSIAIDPQFTYARDNLANLHLVRAGWQSSRGQDPRPSFAAAIEILNEALAINPNFSYGHVDLGETYRRLAFYQLEQELDPTASLEQAADSLAQGLDLNPYDGDIHTAIGRLAILQGRWQMSQGQQPREAFERAASNLAEAAILKPSSIQVHLTSAELHRWRATWRQQKGQSIEREVASGLEHIDQALASQPNLADAFAKAAALHLLLADSYPDRRVAEQAKARDLLTKAIAINRNLERSLAPLVARAGG